MKGARLSRVQHFGTELLILADGWAEGDRRDEEFREQLRMAMVAAGRDPASLWPEARAAGAPEPGVQDLPVDDEGVDFDYSPVDWQEDASADEWERMQQALQASRVEVSGGHGVPEAGPPVPDMGDEYDEREWL